MLKNLCVKRKNIISIDLIFYLITNCGRDKKNCFSEIYIFFIIFFFILNGCLEPLRMKLRKRWGF